MIVKIRELHAYQPQIPARRQGFSSGHFVTIGFCHRAQRRSNGRFVSHSAAVGILLALVLAGFSAVYGAEERTPALVVIDTGICPSQTTEKEAPLAAAFILETQNELKPKGEPAPTFSENLLNADEPLRDTHGHGTHVCGILWRELKVLRESPEPALVMLRAGEYRMAPETLIRAIRRTRELASEGLRPQVLLCAFNLYPEDCKPDEFEAFEADLRKLMDDGVWIVAAAGNRGQNLDEAEASERSLPASAKHTNLIVVAAADERGMLTSRSNFGPNSVWIAAQGVRVESLWIDGQTKTLSGTSQAAAIVAARIFHQALENPGADLAMIRQKIEASAKLHPSLLQMTISQKFLPRATTGDSE